jgi:hypothetical protein
MTTMVSNRRSSFGQKCCHCGDEIIAPEWTEHRNEMQIHHVWRCWSCACCFETTVNTLLKEGASEPSSLVLA